MGNERANDFLLYQAVVNETVFQFRSTNTARPQDAGTKYYVRKNGIIHYALPVGDGQYVVGPVADRDRIMKDEGISQDQMAWRNANIYEVGHIVDEDSIEEMLFKGDDRRLAGFVLLVAIAMIARWIYLLQ